MEVSLVTYSLGWWEVFLAGLATLGIYSFLYRENPIYRFYEHLFIGIATGYGIVYSVSSLLWPQVLKPLLGLDLIEFPDGTLHTAYDQRNLLWLIPVSFGLLYYCILTKKHKWLAELVIGSQLGFAGGLAFKGTFIELLPQIFDTFKPIYVVDSFAGSLTNIVFLLTFICALSYFFFTFKPKAGETSNLAKKTKAWLVAVTFALLCGLTTVCYRIAPQPFGKSALDYLMGVPLAVAAICAFLTLNHSLGGVSDGLKNSLRLWFGAGILLLLISVTLAWFYAPVLLDIPIVNMAAVLTLLALLIYFFFTSGREHGGVVAVSSGLGRWLMMGCFGAFFGSTIMARMALLVERLEFLIRKWGPLFFG